MLLLFMKVQLFYESATQKYESELTYVDVTVHLTRFTLNLITYIVYLNWVKAVVSAPA